MLFFLFMFVLFMSLLVMLVNNVVIWWSVFLIMTLLFVMLNKSLMSYSSLFNYFIMQESLGLLFLMLSFGYMQLFILLLKIGVAPLHFWLFSVLNGVSGFNMMWFLTFQKLPFLLILLQVLCGVMIFFLLTGLMICLVQMLLMKSYKNLLILSSTESFNWIVLSFMMSFINVFFLFVYYFLLMVYLIPKFNNLSVKGYYGWETVLVFMNLPFSVNFFIKIFVLGNLLGVYSYYILLLLFLMFLSVLSLSFWLINLSVSDFLVNKYSKSFYLFLVPMMLLVLL